QFPQLVRRQFSEVRFIKGRFALAFPVTSGITKKYHNVRSFHLSCGSAPMSEYDWLTVYCVAVLLFSMCGGYIPFVGRVSHTKLQFYLSASAGVMLGAAFFHVMPDAQGRLNGFWFGLWLSVGVVGMFFIARFIAPHTHEIDSTHHAHHDHAGDPESCPIPHHHNHAHRHEGAHAHGEQKEYPAVAPAMAGWMAVLGLTIHTFMNGVGLAGAVQEPPDSAGWLPRITGLTWP